jgi:hypothetical protein
MTVMANSGLPPENWDAELQAKGGHFLQSRIWGQFQQALGRQVYHSQRDGWMWLGVMRRSSGIKYLMSSYGPLGTTGPSFAEAFSELVSAGKIHKCDFVRFEPTGHVSLADLEARGAVSIGEIQPQFTRIIDLTRSEDELRAGLTSGHRNLINGTERRGIVVKKVEDPDSVELFLKMLKDTASRSKVTFYPNSYYRKLLEVLGPLGAAKLYLASVKDQPVAAALFYDWGDNRYYAHAGAFQELNRQHKASVSLVWQAILDAKADGKKRFDLWGIAPENQPDHPWAGITQFKTSFGGETVSYLGTWDMPIHKMKYRLYELYRVMKGRK